MDKYAAELSRLIKNKPSCLNSSRGLRSALLDNHVFGNESLKTNLLVMAHEAGIVSKPCNNSADANRLMNKLQTNYGISADNAYWAVDTWLVALGKKSSQGREVAPVSTPPRPPKPVPTNSNKLWRYFKTIFGHNNSWTVYRRQQSNEIIKQSLSLYEDIGISTYTEIPNKTGKAVSIDNDAKRLILAKFNPTLRTNNYDGFFHITAWEDRSAAWALTEDGFYLMGGEHFIDITPTRNSNDLRILREYLDGCGSHYDSRLESNKDVNYVAYKDISKIIMPNEPFFIQNDIGDNSFFPSAAFNNPKPELDALPNLQILDKRGRLFLITSLSGIFEAEENTLKNIAEFLEVVSR